MEKLTITKKLTVREFLNKFDNGDFDSTDVRVQIKAGWFDWFCRDSALKNKTISLAKRIKSVCKTGFIDIDKTYVYMKNNCPMSGKNYDNFGINDIETDDSIVWIAPKLGFSDEKLKNKTEIFMNDESKYFDSWKEAMTYLKELKNEK